MDIKFNDIGILREASLSINGITVIAGENDSGKSTVGKLLYSIINSYNTYEDEFTETIADKLKDEIQRTYFELRRARSAGMSSSISKLMILQNRIRRYQNDRQALSTYFDVILDALKKIRNNDNKEIIDEHLKNINSINKLFLIPKSQVDLFKPALESSLSLEFKDNLRCLFAKSSSIVEITDGEHQVLNFEIGIDNNIVIRSYDNIEFKDVTYIESPFIIDVNINNLSLRERKGDLLRKLKNTYFNYDHIYEKSLFDSLNVQYIDSECLGISKRINKTVGGAFVYDEGKDEFSFLKGHYHINSSNIATGIKSLGILNLLINNGVVKKDHLLIIDEPEVHLHPQWQIEYGKILAELASAGFNILITTHSPYIVEAVNFYSKGAEKCAHFYITEKRDENYVSLEECTNDINRIFKRLADPLEELIWNKN